MRLRLAAFWGVFLMGALLDNRMAAQERATANAPPTAKPTPASPKDAGDTLPPGEDLENRLLLPLLKHIVQDQKTFWTFPARLRTQDLRWVVPSAAFTGAVIASDSWIAKQAPQSASQIKQSKNTSNYALYSLVGVTGGSYILGKVTHNDHLQEAGFLAGEAAFNSTAVTYILKAATQRERPYQGNGHGTFFQGGSSFPSEHAAVAWSAASVFAHEYPGTLTQIFAYGLASAVTVSRITAQQHFSSDALIGSALGWYFGRQVYRARHDHELGGTSWGSILPDRNPENARNPENMGSSYVALDSWVYPALQRLQGLGYLHQAYLDQRPWTRRECASMVEAAAEAIPDRDDPGSGEAAKLYRALAEEFAPERALLDGASNLSATLDSIYGRFTGISGPPVRDSFHFNQTLTNDYGRPYSEGSNTIFGLSGHAEAGRFFMQVRAEYQQSPDSPLYPSQTIQAIEQVDRVPSFANPTASVSRPVLLEGLVGFSFRNTQVSFGKETAWLGPARSGSLLMSNNATPLAMVRVDSVEPYYIPGISRLLGPVKAEFFIGQLSGQTYVFNGSQTFGPQLTVQPFLHGDRITFKPTENLEVGMGISVMFGGQDLPFTWENFFRTYYVHSPETSVNPGKRFSGLDFTYRIPGLRNWLTLYLDSLVVDEVSPIGSTRPNLSPGLYMPQIPKLHQMEFRLEGLKTAQAPHEGFPPGYVYMDRRYLAGYTNDGLLIGNWIGRAGVGGQAWATYNFSARNSLEFSYRHQSVDHSFLQGGHLNDFSVQSQIMLHKTVGLSAFVQYERWAFPALEPLPKSNVVASFQFTFKPGWRVALDGAGRTRQRTNP